MKRTRTKRAAPKRHRMPRGWHLDGPNGSCACPHRDLSVCPECAERYSARLIVAYGAYYWYETDAARETDLTYFSLRDPDRRHVGPPAAR